MSAAQGQIQPLSSAHGALLPTPEPSEWNGEHLPVPKEEWPLRLVAGGANPQLSQRISEAMGIHLSPARVERFPDSELIVKLDEDVRGRDTFVIQSTCAPVNDTLMELLISIDCLRRASANRITAVVPYFGYARQDRKDEGRVPITAKLVANLLVTAGAQRVLTMDLHAPQIQGFFDIPVDHLTAQPVISKHIAGALTPLLQITPDNTIVVSPDVGNSKRAQRYASEFGLDIAIVDKRRTSGSSVAARRMIGNVADKHVLMFDDMIATAGTVTEAAKFVKERGCRTISIMATHAVLCGPAVDRICDAPIDRLIVTDTIPLSPEAQRRLPGLKVLTVAELIGEAIWRIHRNQSVSVLFDRPFAQAK